MVKKYKILIQGIDNLNWR